MPDLMKFLDELAEQDEQPISIAIDQPNGEPWLGADGQAATIDIIGEESKTFIRRLDSLERNIKKLFAGWTGISKDDRSSIVAAMAGTVGWKGWEINGQQAEFNNDNLIRLYRAKHIRLQVLVQIRKHSDFFENGSRT